jgi:hypothetical protein
MNNDSKASAPEEKHRMIEKAAYYRAEKRGFFDSDPVEDWLEAEREIDDSFQHPDDARASDQERAAYKRMRAEFKKILASAQDKINADTIKQAFDRTSRELKELGEFFPETVDRAGKRLKHDVAAAVEKMGPRWDAFSERSHGLFEIWKDKGGQFVNQACTALNAWVSRYRDKNGKE